MSEELRKAELDLFPTPVSVYDLEYYDFQANILVLVYFLHDHLKYRDLPMVQL